MRIAVIGAGAAGLCAIRHALSFGCEVIAFEQSNKIGGTWVYTDKVGKDKYGNVIHSSMYRTLHTNLPKELMSFPDFPFPTHEKSFVPADTVNDYLNLYADNFKLRPHIRFEYHVNRVKPSLDDGMWEVIVKSLADGKYETLMFDAVLVCNGHFSTPNVPHFVGMDLFRGSQIHSHDYRTPNRFEQRRVLVIGAGPSGIDISQEITKVGAKVFWSNHLTPPKVIDAENLQQKPDVARFTENGAEFNDGSVEKFDDVIYCTGYKYTFPFISVDCELSTDGNYIRPLYKHCLNINQPSMAIIGLPVYVCPFQMFDLQIRFCLQFMTGRKKLPSKDEMLLETEREMNEQWQRGLRKSKAHALGKGYQDAYFAALSTTAEIEPVKPVVLKMYNLNRDNQQNDFANYRRYNFTILDDENFEAKLPT